MDAYTLPREPSIDLFADLWDSIDVVDPYRTRDLLWLTAEIGTHTGMSVPCGRGLDALLAEHDRRHPRSKVDRGASAAVGAALARLFLEQQTVRERSAEVRATEMRDRFEQWCDGHWLVGVDPEDGWAAHGVVKERVGSTGGRYRGLTLVDRLADTPRAALSEAFLDRYRAGHGELAAWRAGWSGRLAGVGAADFDTG